ncbi:MAG: peptide ABC transporter substrate-binding protein [Bdellovibrionaceae bacterium]|jgi:peptide/nickel transport system substrate-binding protein|nr:peptide ABC transporter substrate-binding protein [Pseudobdellovibrionaceae bacterium]
MKMTRTLIALAACVGLMNQVFAKATNDELKIGIAQEFDSLNPILSSMVASSYIRYLVNRRLTNLDSNSKWQPQIVKELPTIENGLAKIITVDGKKKIVTTWEIKDAVKWGDGTPLTCQDIIFSREVALSNNVSIPEREVYEQIEKIDVDAKNSKKCTFTYQKAIWNYVNQQGTFYLLPKHLEEKIFDKFKNQKEGYEKNSNYTKNPTNPGLYNGPYVVSGLKLGDNITLVPNKHFYGEAPKIKRIIIKLIPNTGTLEANLRSGTVDKISVLGLTFDQAISLEKKIKSENVNFTVSFEPSTVYEHIDLNLDNPILKDIKVRKALATAIDKEQLVKSLFEGKQPAAMHFITPKDPWYTDDPMFVTTYRYSKRQAAKMLDEAGWKEDKDGYRYKDGKKLSLNFMTTAGNKTREAVQVYLQNQWKQVGIEIIIKNEPGRVFFGETTKKRRFDMAMYAWVANPENNPRSTQHSGMISSEKNGWSGQNYPGWNNPRMDKLIEDMDGEFNPKKRIELAAEMQKLYTDELPVLPLYYRTDNAVVPKNLKNFKIPGHQFSETNEVERWTLE